MSHAGPEISSGDRLAATLIFSMLAHGVVLLGIGFSVEDPAPVLPTLDVILVQTHSNDPPEKADFLANASQQGGGESEKTDRPSDTQPAPAPNPVAGVAPVPVNEGAPKPQTASNQAVVASVAQAEFIASTQQATPTPTAPLPNSRELIERSLEMARLAASVAERERNYAKRPNKKFISANTQEYEFARYLKAWQARVERIGNLNYPDEARRRDLQGHLVLTVGVRRDGTVEEITVVQSSGFPVLDDASIRTVRMAEPFAPLPKDKDNTDILYITRTWHYLPGNVMESR